MIWITQQDQQKTTLHADAVRNLELLSGNKKTIYFSITTSRN